MLAVAELMRRHNAIAQPEASLARIIELMVDMDLEGVLIVDARGRVVGTVGDEQLVAKLHASPHRPWWRQLVADGGASWSDGHLSTVAAAEVMLRRMVTVVPTTAVVAAIRLFDEYAANVLPVIDGRQTVLGAVYRRGSRPEAAPHRALRMVG
jgi:CBS-domain-containing membrane protein